MLLFRQKLILAKLESSYGVDPTLTGGANAILTKDLQIQTFQGNTVDLNYDKGHLGNDKSIYVSPYSTLGFGVDIAGAGTAGVAPAYGPLLRACGFQEIVNASAVTDTAQSGTTTTVVLAASDAAADDDYNDLLIRIASGTGSGQVRRITDYVASTKTATVYPAFDTAPDNTSVYSIDAQVVYAPVSASFESLYSSFFLDGVRHRAAGARGTVAMQFSREGLPMFQFNFTAQRVAADASPNPVADFSGFTEPLPVSKTNTPALQVHGYAGCVEQLNIDVANNVVHRDVINCKNVFITERAPTMQLVMEHPTIGEKNFDAIVAAHTAGEVYLQHGTAAGNIVRVDLPRTQLMNPQIGESDSIATLSMDGRPLPSDAGNDEIFITVM